MPQAAATRRTISWSADTDRAIRSYLGAQGEKRGAISAFVEDAVKWRLFNRTVSEVQAAFSDLTPKQVDQLIDEAVTSVRRRKKQGRARLNK